MAGKPGRGGQNALTLAEHQIAGTYRADRHEHLKIHPPAAAPLSPSDRRRTLAGLPRRARQMAAALLDDFTDWNAASLDLLRSYARSCARLETITDDAELRRETRLNVLLFKALDLEGAR